MLQTSYGIWVLLVGFLLIGLWLIKRRAIVPKKMRGNKRRQKRIVTPMPASQAQKDVEYWEQLSQMIRQTDSVLNGLSKAIQAERGKLNALMNTRPTDQAIGSLPSGEETLSGNPAIPHDRIIPMARRGETVSAIAQQLKLPEAEVSMVLRMNAA